MELIKRLDPLWTLLVVLVAGNAAINVVFSTDVVHEVLGSGTVSDVFYVLGGIAALTFIPKLMEMLHITTKAGGAHPRGA
jgi:uncharacterized membrane protein YuzA (DUF378 family)